MQDLLELEEKITFRKHIFLALFLILVISGGIFLSLILSGNLKVY